VAHNSGTASVTPTTSRSGGGIWISRTSTLWSMAQESASASARHAFAAGRFKKHHPSDKRGQHNKLTSTARVKPLQGVTSWTSRQGHMRRAPRQLAARVRVAFVPVPAEATMTVYGIWLGHVYTLHIVTAASLPTMLRTCLWCRTRSLGRVVFWSDQVPGGEPGAHRFPERHWDLYRVVPAGLGSDRSVATEYWALAAC